MTSAVREGGEPSQQGGHMPDVPEAEQQAFRVRLLGSLTIERADGTLVPHHAWRTGKSLDLLRLLALDNGWPVRVGTLTASLWPASMPKRAAGSLRTAASEVRRNVGATSVVRQLDALLLAGAWVDVPEYRRLAQAVHLAARDDSCELVLDHARAAETLYTGDFHAYDDDAIWARTEREALRQTRAEVVAEAATCALHLGLLREARDFARTAVALAPTAEQAHRALMSAHAGLGEVAAALHVFEGYRTRLADELGADPSVQTRELHLRLLRGLDSV